jgi:hypothetical protein
MRPCVDEAVLCKERKKRGFDVQFKNALKVYPCIWASSCGIPRKFNTVQWAVQTVQWAIRTVQWVIQTVQWANFKLSNWPAPAAFPGNVRLCNWQPTGHDAKFSTSKTGKKDKLAKTASPHRLATHFLLASHAGG